MDGGTQIMVFVLSFAVFGAAGKARPFPAVRLTSSCMFLDDGILTYFGPIVGWQSSQ